MIIVHIHLWHPYQDWSLQCPSNAIWPFKIHSLKNNPLKHNPKLKTKTPFKILNIICPPQDPTKRRALSLQEVELDGWFLIFSHSTRNMYHIMHAWVWYEFCVSFYILELTSWIWTNPSPKGLEFENPSKWNLYEGFNLEHCSRSIKILSLTTRQSETLSSIIEGKNPKQGKA